MVLRLLRNALTITIALLASIPVAWADECPARLLVVRHADSQLDDDDRFLMATLAALGCELQIQRSTHRVTLLRRLELLRDGEIDLMIGLSKFPERERYAHFSVPVREARVRIWVRREDAAKVTGKLPAQLIAEGWRVIGPSQGWYGPVYDEVRKQPDRVVDYKTFEQAMRLLHGHRGDLILGDEVWASAHEPAVTEQLYMLPEQIYGESLFVAFSKATVSPEFVHRFDQQVLKQIGKVP